MKHLLLTVFLTAFYSLVFAQVQKPSSDMNYRKKITMADDFFLKGDYGSAAIFYQSAFEEKTSKPEIAAKAAVAFEKVRDYKNAALMYKEIKEDAKTYPKAKLNYALALKQSGEYKTAATELESFINGYRGDDFNDVNDRVLNEINGCELALKLIEQGGEVDIEIEHLSRMVNSDENEFAPIPFVENLLYFSSMRDGNAQIFRSERGGNGWDRPEKPQIFGSMEKPHFGHGSFTPDRKAFYFTQCEMNKEKEFRCELYVMQRMNNTWSKPIRLPDYINEANTTNTMPFVTVIDNKEILYYVSDKEGGLGKLDIWYVIKENGSGDFSFSLPVNAGIGINTIGNDITPFYDKTSEVMFFSSDGHPGFGGFDVFRSNGHLNKWDKPVNLGQPTNSGADDSYYIMGASKEYGYFVSNRLEGTSKEFTNNDDIFYFEKREIEVAIKGSISEARNTSKLLDNVTVELIEINETGRENSLITKIFNDGEYYFKLSPNKSYKIEASKDGYETTYFEIATNEFTGNSDFTQDLTLEKTEPVAHVETTPSRPEKETNPAGVVPGRQAPVKPSHASTTPTDVVIEEEESIPTKIEPEIPGKKPPVKSEPTVASNNNTKPPVKPAQKEETVVENTKPPVKPAYDGEQTINFEALSFEERKNNIMYVDGKPYIRKNGVLYTVTGIGDGVVVENPIVTTTGKIDNTTETGFGITASEPETGEFYKIQLIAVSSYKPHKYDHVSHLGAIQLETTIDEDGNEVSRVMLTAFRSLEEAKEALEKIVNNEGFERAYIVKYVDGTRVKNSKIRLATFRG